jgi:hypothetical protein
LRCEPVVDVVEKLFDGLAFVIPSHRFVHVPPDSFDRVRFRSIAGQEVNGQTVTPSREIVAHGPAVVERCVVSDHMDVTPGIESAAKVIQMANEFC